MQLIGVLNMDKIKGVPVEIGSRQFFKALIFFTMVNDGKLFGILPIDEALLQ